METDRNKPVAPPRRKKFNAEGENSRELQNRYHTTISTPPTAPPAEPSPEAQKKLRPPRPNPPMRYQGDSATGTHTKLNQQTPPATPAPYTLSRKSPIPQKQHQVLAEKRSSPPRVVPYSSNKSPASTRLDLEVSNRYPSSATQHLATHSTGGTLSGGATHRMTRSMDRRSSRKSLDNTETKEESLLRIIDSRDKDSSSNIYRNVAPKHPPLSHHYSNSSSRPGVHAQKPNLTRRASQEEEEEDDSHKKAQAFTASWSGASASSSTRNSGTKSPLTKTVSTPTSSRNAINKVLSLKRGSTREGKKTVDSSKSAKKPVRPAPPRPEVLKARVKRSSSTHDSPEGAGAAAASGEEYAYVDLTKLRYVVQQNSSPRLDSSDEEDVDNQDEGTDGYMNSDLGKRGE